MRENEVAKAIVDASYKIHTQLGPGLLESVYEVVLAHELRQRGFEVRRQVPVSISYEGLRFDEGYRLDLLVDECVVVELKFVEELSGVHKKQLLTYLKLADKRLGLLVNFNTELIKDGICRVVNGLPQ
ncbi:GxxExxY protein [Botrimarina sp.]|uniref:GxxExxY protein n=1 Tax=Botrimarina sp. TaxID=2795802 RepID=UPI0032EB5494